MKKILTEPLIHFLLLGLAMFILFGLVSKKEDGEEVILIDDYDVDNIIASWEMQWKRLPTDQELKNLIQQNVRQEVFYQEALKMNLDHNDEIIKRRLAQKMEFLSNDLATIEEPSDEQLMSYFMAHENDYLIPAQYSFYQLIFSPDNRDDPKKDAVVFLEQSRYKPPSGMENSGDPLPFPYFFDEVDATNLNRNLGMDFSESLDSLPINVWSGPVNSGFGWHLIYMKEKVDPRVDDFASVRNELVRDLEYENQKMMYNQVYKEFKKNYNVVYELNPDKFDDAFIEFLREENSDE